MAIGKDGHRTRYYAERKKVEAQHGNPVRDGVTDRTRRRIALEVLERSWFTDELGFSLSFKDRLLPELNKVFLLSGPTSFLEATFDTVSVNLSVDDFLQFIEICVSYFDAHRKDPQSDINVIQSLLADDLSVFRLVDTVKEKPRFQIRRIDNEHLHREIVDRTFELTNTPAFASAQGDYAKAWKHYSKGDLDDAVVNAHKAFESAAKVVIKEVDPTSAPEQMQTNQLVPELVRLDILPSKLNNMVGNLQQVFMGAGSLRNSAGTGHGALVPTSPEASVALMALRMSGTLVSFLAERRKQMTTKS